MNITSAILMLITLFGIPFKGNEDVDSAFLYMSLIPWLVCLFYQFRIGYRLINISNDFVGRLRTVGYSIIFSISIYFIVFVLIATIEEDETWLTVYLSLSEIIPMIPIILMLNLLRKAAKYADEEEESQVNNNGS
jgi:L-asparagine transporter-like permease